MKTFYLILTALSSFLLSTAVPVLAHKVNVFAYVEGGTCYVEGYFSRSRRAQNALVEVFGPGETKLLEGRTDKEGRFSFQVSQKTDLYIVLTSSLGHRNDFSIAAEEITGLVDKADLDRPSFEQEKVPPLEENEDEGRADAKFLVDRGELQEILDETLDEKLKPLYGLMAKSQQDRANTSGKVIAGIGYILGIFGLAMFLVSRRKA